MDSSFFIMKTINKFGRHNYPTRRDKEEFVYMYKEEMSQIPFAKGWYEFCKHPMTKWIGERARWFFDYSPNYPNADIALKLRLIYHDMFIKKEVVMT